MCILFTYNILSIEYLFFVKASHEMTASVPFKGWSRTIQRTDAFDGSAIPSSTRIFYGRMEYVRKMLKQLRREYISDMDHKADLLLFYLLTRSLQQLLPFETNTFNLEPNKCSDARIRQRRDA